MPRYFFHLYHSDARLDEQGTEFASDTEAWESGTQACGEMIKDLDGTIDSGLEYRMECVDEAGRAVFTVRFSAEAFFRLPSNLAEK